MINTRKDPDVGDIVKVPVINDGPILGSTEKKLWGLVEAEIVSVSRSSSYPSYTVKRKTDGKIQKGNGHMIREIVRRAEDFDPDVRDPLYDGEAGDAHDGQ